MTPPHLFLKCIIKKTRQSYKFYIYTALIASLQISSSCDKSDLDSNYSITKYYFGATQPCNIHFIFQVANNNLGVSNLDVQNFKIQEDDINMSRKETQIINMKLKGETCKFKTAVMIDNSVIESDEIETLKNALSAMFDKSIQNHEIAICAFSEGVNLIQDYTSDNSLLKNAILNISSASSDGTKCPGFYCDLLHWEDKFTSSALELGTIIFITNSISSQSSIDLLSELNSKRSKKVMGVEIGGRIDEAELRNIASFGYYHQDNYSDLSNTFTIIQDRLSEYFNSFYWLMYVSPQRGAIDHKIKLSIYGNSNILNDSYILGEYNSSDFFNIEPGVIINGGIDSLELNPGIEFKLIAETYLSENNPSYTWQTSDANILPLKVDKANDAIASIIAMGSTGQRANIMVTDNVNFHNKSIVVTIRENPHGQFTDSRDCNIYKTIRIGEQVWMAENLRFEVMNGSWYYDDHVGNGITYGRLYNWDAALQACPKGWHLPEISEWEKLEEYLIKNGYNYDGSTIEDKTGKSLAANNLWGENAKEGSIGNDMVSNNKSGFSALPGGWKSEAGYFTNKGTSASFWSSTPYNSEYSYVKELNSYSKSFNGTWAHNASGSSIRCIRD